MCGYQDAVDLAATMLRLNRITAPAVEIGKLCDAYGLTITETRPLLRPAMLDRRARTIHVARMRSSHAALHIAHEFAHWILPPEYPEESCDTLAHCVLMPHDWIISDIRKKPLHTIASHYGVTRTAVRARLRYLQMELDMRWE